MRAGTVGSLLLSRVRYGECTSLSWSHRSNVGLAGDSVEITDTEYRLEW